MFMFFIPQLVIGDPDMLKDILVRDWHVFADRQHGRKSGNPIIDSFLTALSGNEWKRMRSVMSPTFTSGKMKSMFTIMNDCCHLMVDNIKQKIDHLPAHDQGKLELDMRHLSGCYSMDVIAKCCFATDTNSFNDPNQIFVTQARNFMTISKTRVLFAILLLLLPIWMRKLIGFSSFQGDSMEFFKNVSKAILEQRKKDGHSNEQLNGANDYLQLLIEASKDGSKKATEQKCDDEIVPDHESHHGYEDGKMEDGNEKANESSGKESAVTDLKRPLTDDEIVANSVLFLAAGYETTGSLISMTTYCLACNPDAQKTAYMELKRVHEESGGKFNYETISGLKYLDAVISETLRLLPPAPLTERRAMEDYTFKKNGVKIPEGGSVILPIWNLHHDPKFWENPGEFEPERFLPENRHKIVPYTYLPFGAGPRNCIGMRFALLEAKLAIANLVLNFKFSPCSQTDIPLDVSGTLVLLKPKRVFVGVETR